MKKRKSPILLFSVLLVLVASAVMFGMSQGGDKPVGVDEPATNETLGGEQKAPTTSELEQKVRTQTAGGTKAPSMTAMPVSGSPKPNTNTGPTIAIPKENFVNMKPRRNPSGSTSSQWYDH